MPSAKQLVPVVIVLIVLVVGVSLLSKGVEDEGLLDEEPSTPETPPDEADESEEPEVVDREGVTPLEDPQVPARGFYMGTLPIPYEGQGFEEAYSAVSDAGEIVPVWGKPSPYYELAEEISGSWGEIFVDGMIRGNGLAPLVHMSFIDAGLTLKVPPGLEGATLSDPEWRRRYVSAVLDVVNASRPRFLSVGNEVNRWYEKYGTGTENGFEHFVSLYEEVYDAVKAISPETRVFCTFAREVVSENREADLGILDLFDPDKMDMLVFTSYPYSLAGVNRPEDIPDDYYVEASNYMPGKPFGFSEIAWSSLEAFGGEEGQAGLIWDLVGRLTLDQGVDLELVMWSWLTDLSPEDTTGLISRDGTPKTAYEAWTTIAGWGE
ncbi:hypothetical protein HQ586_09725 [Candidatus Bathyarchaeota archaeon]|nr:hypothetical protein [Candidatus Bathyarchaeota archaeon]